MYSLIENYINRLSLNDVVNIATNNNINLNQDEADFIYNFVKKNWRNVLANPNSLTLDKYKEYFSEENYYKINILINEYRNKYAKFI